MLQKIILTISLLTIMTGFSFSMIGKVSYIPLKPSENLSISDGEFLHYGKYNGGEKITDVNFVTRIENIKGKGKYTRIYMEGSNIHKPKVIPENYSNYTSYYIVSLDKASLLESTGEYRTNDYGENVPSGFNGEVYWHYKMDENLNKTDYLNNIWNGYALKTKKNEIKFKPGFPIWDITTAIFFAPRVLDFKSPGITYYIVPEIIKEPLPVIYRFLNSETINIKAGRFKVQKVGFLAAVSISFKIHGINFERHQFLDRKL